MTELMFPSGLVRIEENHVWVELSRWLDRNRELGGDVMLRPQGETGFSCRLFVGEQSWSAQSYLSLADAVANCLQAAVSAEVAA